MYMYICIYMCICIHEYKYICLYMRVYIYKLDSHMAPYGACEVAQSTARSKAQFEAERFRTGFRIKNKHGRKCFRRKKKHARKCFRRKKEACSSSDFERSLASKHTRAVISNVQWPSKEKEACSSTDFDRPVAFKCYRKQARDVIWSAQRPKSKLEQ